MGAVEEPFDHRHDEWRIADDGSHTRGERDGREISSKDLAICVGTRSVGQFGIDLDANHRN